MTVGAKLAGSAVAGIATLAVVQEAAAELSTSQMLSLFGVLFGGALTFLGWLLHRRWNLTDSAHSAHATIEIEHIRGLQSVADRQIAEIARQEQVIQDLRGRVDALEAERSKARARDALIRSVLIALTDEVAQLTQMVGSKYRTDKDLTARVAKLRERAADGLRLYDEEAS